MESQFHVLVLISTCLNPNVSRDMALGVPSRMLHSIYAIYIGTYSTVVVAQRGVRDTLIFRLPDTLTMALVGLPPAEMWRSIQSGTADP